MTDTNITQSENPHKFSFDTELNNRVICENQIPLDKKEHLRKLEPADTLKRLRKRAKKKYVTQKLMNKLLELDSPLRKNYKSSCSCGSTLHQKDGKITSRYCGYRWCLLCNSIRTAQYIEKYEPVLNTWETKYMLTLTIPNVRDVELLESIKGMSKNFRRISDLMRKRKYLIRGIRKLEITYNKEHNTYHPHFHILIEGKEQADAVRTEWLRLYPNSNPIAQDIAEVKNCPGKPNKNPLAEIFKYVTKLFVIDYETKKYKEVEPFSLDVIFRTIKGLRTLQPFGFVAPKINEEGAIELTESVESVTSDEIIWHWVDTDWFNIQTGEALTNYEPSEYTVKQLLETRLIAPT